jgi:hypothetical protein
MAQQLGISKSSKIYSARIVKDGNREKKQKSLQQRQICGKDTNKNHTKYA